jgi:uncharacterized protein YaaQ
MQLLLAIVQDEDADLLCKRLNAQGFRITRLPTVGGFLARGNVTLLMGVEDEQVDEVLGTIRATCHTRRSFINPMPLGTEPVHLALAAPAMPLEVLVGGATVFAIPVKRFERIQGATTPAATVSPSAGPAGQPETSTPTTTEATPTNLMLVVVQNEDADPVTQALLQAGHRVTRINTAGAFLRRGNVTLLIGVEEGKVDEVLGLIRDNCRLRLEESPLAAGMPMYSATVFVLDASRHIRI